VIIFRVLAGGAADAPRHGEGHKADVAGHEVEGAGMA
jgi:hypothetical protein